MQHRADRPHRRKRAEGTTREALDFSGDPYTAIPDNGVENFITPARDSAIANGEGGGGEGGGGRSLKDPRAARFV